jgi:hypothetical protein
VLAAVLLSGCAASLPLAGIPEPTLLVQLGAPGDRGSVRILPREQDLRFQKPCPRLAPKARATLNGIPLERLTGTASGDDLSYDRDCVVEFVYRRETAAGLEDADPRRLLRVEDESASWTVNVPDAFANRAMTIEEPPDRILRAGSRVVIRWSPPSDHIEPQGIAFELREANSKSSASIVIRSVVVRDDQLLFQVPKDAHLARGLVSLSFIGASRVTPAISACPAHKCVVSLQISEPKVIVSWE